MASSLLVVDDDDHIRAMLQRGLGYEGFQVTVADDGERALGLLRSSPVDCIVLDVRMPQLDGLEVCEILAGLHLPLSTRIALISGEVNETLAAAASAMGLAAVLSKDSTRHQLCERIVAIGDSAG